MTQAAVSESIIGLMWSDNFYAETGVDSYTLVANPGPTITDFHLWLQDASQHFVVRVGQDDRYTFIGSIMQSVRASFVDCRVGSPTLRHSAVLEFVPDPTRCLTIPVGVAMFFSGMRHVTVRSEPILYAAGLETEYAPGNDQIIIHRDTPPVEFPLLSVNDLPLPPEVLQIINRRQQEMLRTGQRYDTTYGVASGNQIVRHKV
jgi:hypothetical protein